MLPQVVDQKLVRSFQFWQGQVQTGMVYGTELYAFYRSYTTSARLQAYDAGCTLAKDGVRTCITCSSSGYTVWTSLRTVPNAPGMNQNAA